MKKYDATIPLIDTAVNKVRNSNFKQYFRKWCFVPSDELIGVKVHQQYDDDGEFFISSTEHYVPVWLRADCDLANVPADEIIVLPQVIS